MNEQDRAFAQCTECHFQYRFIEKPEQDPASLWNHPRTKFCLFISRDICVVTILLQLIIALFSVVVMLLDQNQHWGLTHIFDTTGSKYAACSPDQSNNDGDDSNFTSPYWCRHHALAVYYLLGVLSILVILGILGTSIFCCNGCRFPPHGNHRSMNSRYESLEDVENTAVKKKDFNKATDRLSTSTTVPAMDNETSLFMQRGDRSSEGSNYPTDVTNRRINYYRNQRHTRRNRDARGGAECDCYCTSCGTSNNYYNTSNDYYYIYDGCDNIATCSDCCGGCCSGSDSAGSAGDDSCCCCCHGLHHHHHTISSNSNSCNCDGESDTTAVLLFVLLVILIIMAIIGVFMVLFIGVIVFQRIVQRHMFRLQKKLLVHEFQIADLSNGTDNFVDPPTRPCVSSEPSSSTLHTNDYIRLKKLGLIAVD
jgi:hypothetical protein